MKDDLYDLERFVTAQRDTYASALSEITAGRKKTHWMWFVFPQLAGLGFSSMAQRYAISGIAEAQAYLEHTTLGPRLTECARAALSVAGKSAHEIFGEPDDLKLRSSMTLFAAAAPANPVFTRVLARYFPSGPDSATLRLLSPPPL